MSGGGDGIRIGADGRGRCFWCVGDPLYEAYHDREWGRPVADDRRLFEKLCLEGFQAGLSWRTILGKRENFRRAFAGFDFTILAGWGEAEVARLLDDAGIVRHRGKITAVLENARRACALVEEAGSLAAFLWRFEPDPESRPERLDRETLGSLTASPEARELARELQRRGWKFLGPTTVYAFMQAMGMVNDHLEGCFRRRQVEAERARFARPVGSDRGGAGTGR